METTKIKVKIGDNEFEAEGPVELITSQFADFKELIKSMPISSVSPSAPENQQNTNENVPLSAMGGPIQFDKMFKIDGRVISLTALPAAVDDAALLVMFGQKQYRNNDSVTGSEMMDGLTQSGYRLARTDRIMEKFVTEASVIKVGLGRATRYRLTNQGLTKAQNTAQELLKTLP